MQTVTQAIYLTLLRHAMDGTTTTYKELATKHGLPTTGNQLGSTLAPLLTTIYNFCEKRNDPHLTSLVVRGGKGTDVGVPGAGFWMLYWGNHAHNVSLHVKRKVLAEIHVEVFTHYAPLGLTKAV